MKSAHTTLLKMLEPRSGDWNWYQLSRAWVSRHDPGDLDLKTLVEQGLIAEVAQEGEPLPRLVVTEAGKEALSRDGEETHDE